MFLYKSHRINFLKRKESYESFLINFISHSFDISTATLYYAMISPSGAIRGHIDEISFGDQ